MDVTIRGVTPRISQEFVLAPLVIRNSASRVCGLVRSAMRCRTLRLVAASTGSTGAPYLTRSFRVVRSPRLAAVDVKVQELESVSSFK